MRTDHGAGTLALRLRSGPLNRTELEQLARDLLGMLDSLHSEGTLHRDLNPENIHLDSAARLHSSTIGKQRTGTSGAAESLRARTYVAPEVLAGGESGVAADLFACGVLLAEAAGPDAPAPVLVLIGMLTAAAPDLRPASAREALGLIGAAPARPPAPPAPRAPVAGYRQTFEKPSVPTGPFPPLAQAPVVPDTPTLPVVAPTAYPSAPVAAVAYPRRRPSRRAVLAGLGAVLTLGLVTGGAVALGSADPAESVIPPPAAAPLDQQLDDLDGVIDTLGR